jgi:chorismate mutase
VPDAGNRRRHQIEKVRTKVNERDTKLVQWLNEAHVKEAELEADLGAPRSRRTRSGSSNT